MRIISKQQPNIVLGLHKPSTINHRNRHRNRHSARHKEQNNEYYGRMFSRTVHQRQDYLGGVKDPDDIKGMDGAAAQRYRTEAVDGV